MMLLKFGAVTRLEGRLIPDDQQASAWQQRRDRTAGKTKVDAGGKRNARQVERLGCADVHHFNVFKRAIADHGGRECCDLLSGRILRIIIEFADSQKTLARRTEPLAR